MVKLNRKRNRMKITKMFLVLMVTGCMQSLKISADEREYSWQVWKKRDKDNQEYMDQLREVHYAEPHNKDSAPKKLEKDNIRKLAEDFFPKKDKSAISKHMEWIDQDEDSEEGSDPETYWWLPDDSKY